MNNHIRIFPLIFFFLTGFLAAQNSYWDYYTYSEQIAALQMDGDYIWAATQGGLVQVNRSSLESIVCHRGNSGLPSHQVTHLAKKTNGKIYASAGGRIVNISLTEMRLLSKEQEGIPARGFDGNMWIAGKNSIWKQNPHGRWWVWDSITALPEEASHYLLSDFVLDPYNEEIWLTAWTFGVFRVFHFDGENWESFGHENSPLPFESPGNNKLLFDQRGDLWVATKSGLFTYNGRDWKQLIVSPDLGNVFSCTAIYLDAEKRIWIAVKRDWQAQTRLFRKKVDTWEEFPLAEEISQINDIALSQNEIWLATEGQGLFLQRPGEAWQQLFISNSPLPGNWITALSWDEQEEKIWVAAQDQLAREGKLFFVENGTLFPEAIPPTYQIKQIIREKNGPLWVLGSDALFVKEDQSWRHFDPGTGRIQAQYIERLSFDHEGKLWMIHDDELIIRDSIGQYTYLSGSDVKQNTAMYQLFNHPSRNEAWIGGFSEFSHFDGSTWKRSEEILGEKVVMNDALADSMGVVWFATNKGFLRYDGLKYEWYSPFPREIIDFKSITQSPDGTILLSNGKAIWRYTTPTGWPNGFTGGWDAGRAEILQADDEGNVWIASHGLGVSNGYKVRNYDFLPWTEAHEIGIGGYLDSGENMIFPNPVSQYGDLFIYMEGIEFDRVQLVDMQGKEVLYKEFQQAPNFYKLSLMISIPESYSTNHSTGMYILHVFNGKQLLLTKKVLILGHK